MLDRRVLVETPEKARESLTRRGAAPEVLAQIDSFAALEEERKRLAAEGDSCRRTRNELSPRIGRLMREAKREEAEDLKARVKEASERARQLDDRRSAVESEIREVLLGLPNLLDEAVPPGSTEEDNEVLSHYGEARLPVSEPVPHDELGHRLGILDLERAARLSGSRFAVLYGAGARLERALIDFFLDLHTREHGYREVMVPYVVWRSTMTGTGQLPKFEEDLFRLAAPLNGQDAFLVPTAEVPVTNLHREEILEPEQLPLDYVCFTPCFRAEAGSHGRDTKGLVRQHQFHKVELVKIVPEGESDAAHEALTGHAERCLQLLELPYRKVRVCAGEMSAAAANQVDLEVWLPSQRRYREISSCSNFRDYQARRMGLRYRAPSPGRKKRRTAFCHTINGSGLAVGRTWVALLENHQRADGSVEIPVALRPYMGGVERIEVPG